ncbi:hypothetical protein B0J11DRAFT_112509 [Dendryphion nanum]|uniref:Uncharacterized protein n=1 Tax=Dendryphion nanum TaxID=256645 RepID=A0A9P9ICK9_9PLEO|nr:hypothetical protein B0J11DRAFT_112509 [Dendryphion nanum]
MVRFVLLSAALFCASGVLAQYDQFVFSTNATRWKCPKGLAFDCIAPNVCTHETVLDKWYCCGPEQGSVCWSGSTTCSGSEKNTPGTNQLGCGSYCCLNSREQCTQRTNQINICWATPPNPFVNITGAKINETFSSLSSANPTASTYSFDIKAALATATPTPSASSSSASTGASAASQTATNSPTSTALTSQTPEPSSGLSGGAIGGIVVGVVGGLALLAGLAFFFWRRGKKNNTNDLNKPELESNPSSHNPYNHNGFAHAHPVQQEKYAHEVYTPEQQHAPQFSQYPPQELYAGQGPVEVDGSKPVVHGQHVQK